MTYREFLEGKIDVAPLSGLDVGEDELNPVLKPHQRAGVLWALERRPPGVTKAEVEAAPVDKLQAVYRQYSRDHVYSYDDHVRLAKELDQEGRLPATFMVCAPGSWTDGVWDDINRMRTLNTSQRLKKREMHICPLQLDIVERAINRWSNPGDTILDPFGGLMTVPYMAVKMQRCGVGIELNPDYFRDGVGYLQEADEAGRMFTLFDLAGGL